MAIGQMDAVFIAHPDGCYLAVVFFGQGDGYDPNRPDCRPRSDKNQAG